eukprot:362584-Chlamydomonas_euryale.AAC.10
MDQRVSKSDTYRQRRSKAKQRWPRLPSITRANTATRSRTFFAPWPRRFRAPWCIPTPGSSRQRPPPA